MKSYTDIFEEIVAIMRTDSSTCKDMGVGPYKKYKDLIDDSMPRNQFVKIIKMYICEFKLPGHLKFTDISMGNIDYKVIRKENYLLVTNVARDSLLQIGDKIIKIDGESIINTAISNRVFLMDEPFDRQTDLWLQILMFSEIITVVREGEQIDILTKLSQNVVYESERYFYELQEGKKIYIRIEDFYNDTAINDMTRELEPYLNECIELVIDVKGNGGGSSSAYAELLKYCFPMGEHAIETYGMEMNYSERNCNSRLRIFEEFFGDEISDDLKEALENEKKNLMENKGKGFVKLPLDTQIVTGTKYPLRVLVYTDECCCSAGESFVEIVSQSPKVKVIGRPTMGINDYSNCTNAVWDDFYFAYPTSRDCRIDIGKGLLSKGVPVDILEKVQI